MALVPNPAFKRIHLENQELKKVIQVYKELIKKVEPKYVAFLELEIIRLTKKTTYLF